MHATRNNLCLVLLTRLQDFVTNQPALIPLAGPANRQGRIAADVIMGKEPSRFRGTQVCVCSVITVISRWVPSLLLAC